MYLGYNPIFGIEDGDSLAGTDVDDLLHGAGGNDVISGGIGADVLFGGAGNDMIYGGTGADTINVSQGSDLVIYQNLLDGNDIINGFNAAGTDNDVISLDALFDGLFVDTAERANRILVEANGDMQTLRVDTSGDGSFDLTVATVSFIDGNLLNVGMETEDVQYGSL
jgi:Ca2+-binding RTX toxin-like protein